MTKEEKIKHRKERQERFKKAHPGYFKEYYQALKEGKKSEKASLFRGIHNLIKRLKETKNEGI